MTVTKNQKLIPEIPSEDMITAGKEEYFNCSSNPYISIDVMLRRIYAAMTHDYSVHVDEWTINTGIQPVEDEVMITVKFRDDDVRAGFNAKYWCDHWTIYYKPWDIVEWKYSK